MYIIARPRSLLDQIFDNQGRLKQLRTVSLVFIMATTPGNEVSDNLWITHQHMERRKWATSFMLQHDLDMSIYDVLMSLTDEMISLCQATFSSSTIGNTTMSPPMQITYRLIRWLQQKRTILYGNGTHIHLVMENPWITNSVREDYQQIQEHSPSIDVIAQQVVDEHKVISRYQYGSDQLFNYPGRVLSFV